MPFIQHTFSRLIVAALSISSLSQHVVAQSIPVAYCSTLNTATTNGNSSIYQSEGLCYNFCLSTYAFAVLSGSDCWCSNYVPGSGTTSVDDCSSACVGYPGDWCGDESKGLYAYISLTKSPSGTSGASASSTAAASTQQQTSTSSPKTTAAAETTKSSSPSSTSSSSTWTPTPVVSVETLSGSGVRTVTVTPTSPSSATSSAGVSATNSGGSGLSTGGAVGLTVGLVALVAIIGAIAWCCIRRRRKQAALAAAAYEEHNTPRGSSAGGIPTRTMSENSRYMLGTDGNRVVEAWEGDTAGSRTSRLMPVDPRLDPFAPVYQRGDASKSRESVATIEDGHDYSRRMVGRGKGPLRAVNADD